MSEFGVITSYLYCFMGGFYWVSRPKQNKKKMQYNAGNANVSRESLIRSLRKLKDMKYQNTRKIHKVDCDLNETIKLIF